MSTLTLSCSSGNSPFCDSAQVRITYTAKNGTFTLTEIEGIRDYTQSWNVNDTSVSVSVGGTKKSVSVNYVNFNTTWASWGATDTSWSGLSGSSIKIVVTMPYSGQAYSEAVFDGYATMSWDTYTVSYNANGGSNAPSSQTKTYGTTLTLSNTKPTRTGYTFSEWNTKSDGGGTSYSSGGSYTANSALALYAIWTENKLTINYYSNYATSAFEDALNTVGSSKNVKVWVGEIYYDNDYSTYGLANYSNSGGSIYMTRTGYTATGYWGTSTSGGTLVNENTGFSTGQALAKALGKDLSSGDASINIYAQWQINTYTIAYNANKGSGSMSSQTVNWSGDFTLSSNVFKREGYKFVGWNAYRNDDSKWYVVGQGWLTEDEILTGGYSKKVYSDKDELTLNASWIKGNDDARLFTLYAIWEISGVIYIDNGNEFEPYLIYIDNGTGWDLYFGYIDNGTSWDIVS